MRVFLLAALAALALPAAAQTDELPAGPSIVDVLDADGRFTTLLGALDTAGLRGTLSEPGPYTLFAPTDSAFAALPEGTLAALAPEDLTNVLLLHVVLDAVPAEAALATEVLPSAWSERDLTVAADEDGVVRVSGVAVVEADVAASNGVVHVIGGVLRAPAAPAGDGM